ncbi:MerR family transcriptional regulator [Ktedonosporobacter rubrisoli]|uniref:MerR family transcriptional regulator n=2 Tax=Ktedonosporobacter rubrisoli TaxID=2509675 RepID=A0A4P6K5V4_KTERU|nr:MerR family transcriptional regulator [Ktedonosporobacter rubrisoli]
MNKELSIQQVAEITGLSIHTLRYYEHSGLLASTRIRRLPNGHRRYDEVDLEWIDFVKCLRESAMPIAEMQHFAEITRQGASTVKERRELLEAHRLNLLQDLQKMQQALASIEAKISHYRELENEIEHT